MINLSENATYKVEAPDGRRWALRIHRDGYHSRDAIQSELAWLVDLRQTGVVLTPVPLPGKDGEIIQASATRHWRGRAMSCCRNGRPARSPASARRLQNRSRCWARSPPACTPTPGNGSALPGSRATPGISRRASATSARIGDAGATAWVSMPRRESCSAGTVDLIGARLAAFGKGADRFGLIHGDLRLANLLIDGKTVKVIDFDDCGFGWYMYDAATPISFYEHEPQAGDLIEAWKTGYRRVLDLPSADDDEIPTFVMLRRLLLVAWIGSHAETELAKSMGVAYTEGTVGLCEDYLRKFS